MKLMEGFGKYFLMLTIVFRAPEKMSIFRKRFLCTEVKTNKNYLVSAIAKVTPIE